MKGWQVIENDEDERHVVPKDDDIAHVSREICWCKPTELEPGLWVHHSHDHREDHEGMLVK